MNKIYTIFIVFLLNFKIKSSFKDDNNNTPKKILNSNLWVNGNAVLNKSMYPNFSGNNNNNNNNNNEQVSIQK